MPKFSKYLLLSFAVALVNVILILVLFVPRLNHTDSADYLITIKYVLGQKGGEISLHRILNPMAIFLGAGFSLFFGAEKSLIAQNVLFYFLSVWLVFILVNRLYQNEKQAFYATILYAGAYPMLVYGLAFLTDLPGWFFYILSVLLALSFIKSPDVKKAFFAGLVAGFGLLFKESVAAAPIFFASLILIAAKMPFKEKLKHIFIFGAGFLLLPLINSFILYKLYNYFYLDAFVRGGLKSTYIEGFYMFTAPRIIIEAGRVFLLGWVFFILGVAREAAAKNRERIKIFLALLPPSLCFLLWCCPHNRIMFVSAPLLVLLGSRGILQEFKNEKLNLATELSLLFLYLAVNYGIAEFLLRYGPLLQPLGNKLLS